MIYVQTLRLFSLYIVLIHNGLQITGGIDRVYFLSF